MPSRTLFTTWRELCRYKEGKLYYKEGKLFGQAGKSFALEVANHYMKGNHLDKADQVFVLPGNRHYKQEVRRYKTNLVFAHIRNLSGKERSIG